LSTVYATLPLEFDSNLDGEVPVCFLTMLRIKVKSADG
jgi:hypothetical protein